MSPRIRYLAKAICCYLESPCMTSTGISPRVITLKEFAKLHSNCESILPAIDLISEKTAILSLKS